MAAQAPEGSEKQYRVHTVTYAGKSIILTLMHVDWLGVVVHEWSMNCS